MADPKPFCAFILRAAATFRTPHGVGGNRSSLTSAGAAGSVSLRHSGGGGGDVLGGGFFLRTLQIL